MEVAKVLEKLTNKMSLRIHVENDDKWRPTTPQEVGGLSKGLGLSKPSVVY
jgi:hypothetical protein